MNRWLDRLIININLYGDDFNLNSSGKVWIVLWRGDSRTHTVPGQSINQSIIQYINKSFRQSNNQQINQSFNEPKSRRNGKNRKITLLWSDGKCKHFKFWFTFVYVYFPHTATLLTNHSPQCTQKEIFLLFLNIMN